MNEHEQGIAAWRSALLRAGSREFHDIMRNYLGPVKTPFNKHDLVSRLQAFIARPEIIGALWDSLGPAEIKIVCALAMLGEVTFSNLDDFIGPDIELRELKVALSQLADKLLVFREDQMLRLFPLAPVPADILESWQPFRIVAKSHDNPADIPWPWLNEVSAVGLVLLLQEHPLRLKSDGTFLKKFSEVLDSKLGLLLGGKAADIPRPVLALRALQICGLLDGKLEPFQGRWLEWARMSEFERCVRLWSAAYYAIEDDFASEGDFEDEPGYFDFQQATTDAEVMASILSGLCYALDNLPDGTDAGFPQSTLERLLWSLAGPKLYAELYVETFVELGILTGPLDALALNPEVRRMLRRGESTPVSGGQSFLAQADGTFVVKPGAPLAQLFELLPLFSLERADNVLKLSMERGGAAELFRRGKTAVDLSAALAELCGGKLPQSIPAMLEDWQRKQFSLQVQTGILVQANSPVDAQAAAAAANSAGCRVTMLDETRFFLQTNSANDPAIAAVLKVCARRGLRLQDHLDLFGEPAENLPPWFQPLPVHRQPFVERLAPADEFTQARVAQIARQRAERSSALKQRLHEYLADAGLGPDTTREIELRISSGIIVHESQIHAGITRPEQVRAVGLDHTGKLRLIEAAIEASDYLEIELGDAAETSTVLLRALRLVGKGNSAELVGTTVPGDRELTIGIHRMQSLRRLKSGLFR